MWISVFQNHSNFIVFGIDYKNLISFIVFWSVIQKQVNIIM